MIPVVEQFQPAGGGDDSYWWALALGLGGNATLIGRERGRGRNGQPRRRLDRFHDIPEGRASRRLRVASARHGLHCGALPVTPRRISAPLIRETPVLHPDDAVEDALRAMLESGLPALPVVDDESKLIGVFGEREFMARSSPATSASCASPALSTRGSTKRSRHATRRAGASRKFMTPEHVEVDVDASDVQVAETSYTTGC
jgi:CBS domain